MIVSVIRLSQIRALWAAIFMLALNACGGGGGSGSGSTVPPLVPPATNTLAAAHVNNLSANGPQAFTYTVGGSTPDYSTVSAAILAIGSNPVDVGNSYTLIVADGVYPATSPIYIFGKIGGPAMYIQGQHANTTTFNAVQRSSGSAGAWTIYLTVGSVANIIAGYYVGITSAIGGSLPTYLAGVFKVLSVNTGCTAPCITIASTHAAASAPSGAVAGTLNIYSTVLQFNGSDGIEVFNGGSAVNLQNIAIVGNGTVYNGLSVQDVGRAYILGTVGVAGFGGNNVVDYLDSEINGTTLISSGGGNGFDIESGSTVVLTNAVSSGNTGRGFYLSQATAQIATPSIATGNAGDGFYAGFGSNLFLTNPYSTGNTGWGFNTGPASYITNGGFTGGGNGSGDNNDVFAVSTMSGTSLTLSDSVTAPNLWINNGDVVGLNGNGNYTAYLTSGSNGATAKIHNNGHDSISWNSTNDTTIDGALISAGTAASIAGSGGGCGTIGTIKAGEIAGQFGTANVTACTVTVTFGGPPMITNGTTCWTTDGTTPSNIGTVTSTTTTAVLTYASITAGDTIKFGCIGY